MLTPNSAEVGMGREIGKRRGDIGVGERIIS
jgi:hypothetical protein